MCLSHTSEMYNSAQVTSQGFVLTEVQPTKFQCGEWAFYNKKSLLI